MGNICGGERTGEGVTVGQVEAFVTEYYDDDCKEWNRFLTKVTELILSKEQQSRLQALSEKASDSLNDAEKAELERLNTVSSTSLETLKGDKEKRDQYKNNAWISRDALKELLEELTTERAAGNKAYDTAKNNAHDTFIAAATALEDGKDGDDAGSLKTASEEALKVEEEAK